MERYLLEQISDLSAKLVQKLYALEEAVKKAEAEKELEQKALLFKGSVFTAMCELREVADSLETLVAKKHWAMPDYADLLFGVF